MTYISESTRQLVKERAKGCCEYCLTNQEDSFYRFHVEHIISLKHGGKNTDENLCLSCPECNTYKGTDIGSLDPQTGILTSLFNPREQQWEVHFRLNGAVIESLTPEGRVTVFLLRLNDPDRLEEREGLLQLNRYPCQKT